MSADPTADADGTYHPDDQDGHEAVVEQFEEDKRERQEQLQQNLSVKERLEQAAEEKTQTIDVLGIDVTFQRLPSEDELDLLSIGERFKRMGEDEISRENLQEMRDEVAEIVADAAADAELSDPSWWTDTLGLAELITTGAALAKQNDEVDSEEIEEFRGE